MGFLYYDFLGSEGKKSFYDWEFLHCHKRWKVVCYSLIVLYQHFINGFFLNNNLWIEPKNILCILRLHLWCGLAAIAYREAYEDVRTWNTIERKHKSVEGRYRWLVTGILLTETLICWKYRFNTGHIDFEAAANTSFYIWGTYAGIIAFMYSYWLYLRFKPGHTIKYPLDVEEEAN